MEFSLFSHQPGWQNGYRQALQANEKLEVVFNPPPVSKKLPHSSSFITLNQEHAIISTIKKSEDGNDLVVRIYDQEGRDKDIKLNFFRGIKAIEKTNLIEDDPIQLIDAEKTLNLKVGHHAIETFRFRF